VILDGYLTVNEILYYTAKFKCSGDSKLDIMRKVREIVKALNLENCQDTYVGAELKRGLSGGEAKRLCIGVELISNPKIIFLDEPTSGLDANSAA